MPKFKKGDPQIIFISKKTGKKFTKTYHSAKAGNKAYNFWRRKGARMIFGRFKENY